VSDSVHEAAGVPDESREANRGVFVPDGIVGQGGVAYPCEHEDIQLQPIGKLCTPHMLV
jgi:hypothetical protein